MLLVQHDRVEALAKQAPALAARNEELHLDTVDLSAEHLDRLSQVDLNLVRMNADSQPVEQIYCELGISNGLCAAASTARNIVDVSHTSDLPSPEISNCRQQEFGCDTRSWSEPERHCRTFVADSFEPKAEEQAVLLRDQQMHVEVRHVDLPHVIPPSELGLHCVQTLHLEVLVLEEQVDRGQVDTPPHLVGVLLWHREEGGPHSPSVGLVLQRADRADGEVVLQCVPAGLELFGLACQGSCRVEGLVERWWAVGPFERYAVGQDLDMPGTCDSFP